MRCDSRVASDERWMSRFDVNSDSAVILTFVDRQILPSRAR
jgi:hypothetical protein